MSSGQYRIKRATGAEIARGGDDSAGGAPLARVTTSSPALPLPPLPEDDLALTRAPTEPFPPELIAQIATRAVGTDPPPVRSRLPAPSAPPAASAAPAPTPPASEAPGRMVSFGTTTLLLVPAGDRIALVVPGVLRITGTRADAEALAAALTALPKR